MFYVYGKTVFAYFNKKTRRLNIYSKWRDKFDYNDLRVDLTVIDWFHELTWVNEYIMGKKI